MAEIAFNINYYVRFKPTNFGKAHYRKKREAINNQIKTLDIPLDLKVDIDGFANLQMHEFMHYFGDVAYCGGHPFIEKCEILIKEEHLDRK
ncbi:hypothetical protein [Acinetobacter sp.]|uniref:hypothetical protein n=1 Tax=Acinetobacter sp. TaxID=472 RepID=UPI00291070C0|nr:hypothetical protein [Acinetobacter sp.]MDU4032409.1 hypothetical protein [Acinetobacter sp.]